MTKKERIQAAIRGEKPDKIPYSFWTHMPGTDLDPEAIAEKTYEFYKKYDFDFVKTMNNGMYSPRTSKRKADIGKILSQRRCRRCKACIKRAQGEALRPQVRRYGGYSGIGSFGTGVFSPNHFA